MSETPRFEQQFLYFADANKKNFMISSNHAFAGDESYELLVEPDDHGEDAYINPKSPLGFKINDNYAIFWNERLIWSLRLDGNFCSDEIHFEISPAEKHRRIQDIRLGSNSDLMTIIINQKSKEAENCVLNCNIKTNLEEEAFDV